MARTFELLCGNWCAAKEGPGQLFRQWDNPTVLDMRPLVGHAGLFFL